MGEFRTLTFLKWNETFFSLILLFLFHTRTGIEFPMNGISHLTILRDLAHETAKSSSIKFSCPSSPPFNLTFAKDLHSSPSPSKLQSSSLEAIGQKSITLRNEFVQLTSLLSVFLTQFAIERISTQIKKSQVDLYWFQGISDKEIFIKVKLQWQHLFLSVWCEYSNNLHVSYYASKLWQRWRWRWRRRWRRRERWEVLSCRTSLYLNFPPSFHNESTSNS